VVSQGGVSSVEHKKDEEEEVTSPLKEKETLSMKGISKKALFLGGTMKEPHGLQKRKEMGRSSPWC
jgi:hypothetical protein